uniref:Uncharacterized protein n=1 Tax=Anas platyrhynchos platyrhynchos TaxID=8840 RepID=A0A493TN17_ANAPP
ERPLVEQAVPLQPMGPPWSRSPRCSPPMGGGAPASLIIAMKGNPQPCANTISAAIQGRCQDSSCLREEVSVTDCCWQRRDVQHMMREKTFPHSEPILGTSVSPSARTPCSVVSLVSELFPNFIPALSSPILLPSTAESSPSHNCHP